METRWGHDGHELVAKINCSSGKRTLKGGGKGWFEADSIGWWFDWRLRVEVGVTELKPGHHYNDPPVYPVDADTEAALRKAIPEPLRPKSPGSWLARSRPRAQIFIGPVFLEFVVERDIVEVIFPIPDCIHPFHSGGWGCAEGGRIELSSGRHHCQARVLAKPPNYKSSIRRLNKGIEFIETELGQFRVIGRLEDAL